MGVNQPKYIPPNNNKADKNDSCIFSLTCHTVWSASVDKPTED